MERFVAATDDLLFDVDNSLGPLVPYQPGIPCLRWEAVIADGSSGRVLAVLKHGKVRDSSLGGRRAVSRALRQSRH